MRKLVVSRGARAQIVKTLLYTRKRFGERKEHEYAGLIEEALVVLSTKPEKGKKRPDIHPEIWSYHIARSDHKARHLFLYRFSEDRVEIIRFLYDGMNLPIHGAEGWR